MAIRFDRIELSDDGNHLYPYIEGTDGYLAVRTTSGLLRIGAGNSSYSHFYTDRASYYFNTAVAFDGNISAYDGNENLTNWNNVDASAFRSKANTAYYVDPDGTSNVNKFRFGTSSDLQTGSSKLDVAGISAMRNSSDSSATLYIQNHSSTTSTIQPYIYLADSGGNRGGLGVETSTAIMSVNGQGGLKFQTGASGVSGTEALLIDNSQNARFAGVVEIKQAATNLLTLTNTNNGGGAGVVFNDNNGGAQRIYLRGYHADGSSQGGGASLHLQSTETDLVFVVGDSSNTGRIVVKSANSNSEVDYGFYSDTNTGMYSPAAGTVGLVSDGSRKLNVNNNGVYIQNGNLYIPDHSLYIADYIYHDGDTNTYIYFTS